VKREILVEKLDQHVERFTSDLTIDYLLRIFGNGDFNVRSEDDRSKLSLTDGIEMNKKLRYCEEHSASVVLSWCTL